MGRCRLRWLVSRGSWHIRADNGMDRGMDDDGDDDSYHSPIRDVVREVIMANLCAKTRPISNPYEIWVANGWTWKVLKKWQMDDNKPFARWLCFVTSPYCPEGEYGDTYVKDIVTVASKVN